MSRKKNPNPAGQQADKIRQDIKWIREKCPGYFAQAATLSPERLQEAIDGADTRALASRTRAQAPGKLPTSDARCRSTLEGI